MMQTLLHILYAICNVLLIPVVLALLFFLAWALMLLGGFLRELAGRPRLRRGLTACIAAAKRADAPKAGIGKALGAIDGGLPRRFCERVGNLGAADPAFIRYVLEDLEHDAAGCFAALSLLTRVSPMLGLMGTLIPLGPVLVALSAGDMHAMAQNLIMAFTTTVVGILIGATAYGIGLVRRAWYARDLSDLEFILRSFTEGGQS